MIVEQRKTQSSGCRVFVEVFVICIVIIEAGVIAYRGLMEAPFCPASFFIAVMIGSIIWLRSIINRRHNHNIFNQSFATAQANISDRRITESTDDYIDNTTYYVVVQFNAGESPITLNATVSKEFYERLHPGDTITVRYATADPRVALLEGEYGWESQ